MITPYEIIQNKKRGVELTAAELEYFIRGYTAGEIPDYQAAAFCMAVYFRGMTRRECFDMTMAMTATGETPAFGDLGLVADKHSTGGVSDATTLIIAPLVALSGIKMLKMSGRALGHTGGTIDKLESVTGFNASLSSAEILKVLNSTGAVIVGQSEASAPADKKLYALRDVTATVDSIPLIAASIMSKKLLSPAQILVLDVKYGSGAFLKSLAEAKKLAAYMTYIGKNAGRRVSCILTENNRPFGRFIGNALELYGAVEVLEGAENFLAETSFALVREILKGAGYTYAAAAEFIKTQIASGAAKEKLAEFIAAQGGDGDFVRRKEKLLTARQTKEVTATRGGIIKAIDCEGLGLAAVSLGAGRTKVGDKIDYSAGIELYKSLGDTLKEGDKICKIYYNTGVTRIDGIAEKIQNCFEVE